MSRWWRAYDDAINDPKLLKLSDEMFRAWFTLLCIASKNDGALPPVDDIAVMLRMKPAKVAEWLTKLSAAVLLDKTETGFAPHNWNGRQYKSDVSTDRVKQFRKRKRNVSSDVSETPPETEAETDTERKKETRASALVVDDGWPADFRERFWSRYPNKVGKPKAIAKLEGVRKRGVPFAEVMTGLDRYIASKPPDRAWLNPETFINQERWNDQPAPVAQQGSNGLRNVQDAARSQTSNIESLLRELDEPAPRSLCEPAGGSPVRLLSSR